MKPDSFRLDRNGVRTSFDRASAGYDAAAVLQANINDELLDRLGFFKLEPRVVLDLGSGTGRGARELQSRYPNALVIALDISRGMLRNAHSGHAAALCADTL